MEQELQGFTGFAAPESNYVRIPVEWFELTAGITCISELKVVQYVLRHTWGFHEYGIPKKITLDEFEHGRRLKDGSRMDSGTGLSRNSIKKGISGAIKHGLLLMTVNSSDPARIRRSFALKMASEEAETRGSKFDPLGVKVDTSGGQSLTPVQRKKPLKDTLEKVAVSDANGFTFPDQEEQPQQKSPTVKAAEELHKQLLARRKVMRPPNIQKWAESFRKLLLESDLGITRFEKVLYWYVQHIDEDDYMPAAYSAQTFCDKFLTIERQMQMRCKDTGQDDTPVPQGIIVKGTKESYEAYRRQQDEDDKGRYWEEIKDR